MKLSTWYQWHLLMSETSAAPPDAGFVSYSAPCHGPTRVSFGTRRSPWQVRLHMSFVVLAETLAQCPREMIASFWGLTACQSAVKTLNRGQKFMSNALFCDSHQERTSISSSRTCWEHISSLSFKFVNCVDIALSLRPTFRHSVLNAPHYGSIVIDRSPIVCVLGDRVNVSQPLLHPLPSGSPCYPPSDPSGNCTAVIQEFTDGNWRANQSGTMQFSNFETYIFPNNTISACYLNTTIGGPCEQGSVPIIGVDARTIDDIQSAISFAALHNLRLVVKNTGHDLSGRSTARGSFLVWTHHLKNITFHDSFQPSGAPSTEIFDNAITLGAGVQWHEAYDAVDSIGRVLVGGESAGGSVGAAGGWLLGGGHSELSPQYGLGVDNVLEIAMVTSTGDYLIANAHQHPDLFWALRGGGGGTYGIVTSVTYRTHPSLPLIGAYFIASANSTQPTPALQAVLTEHFRLIPNLSDAGWSGGLSVFPDPTTGNLEMAMVYAFLANSSWAQANESIEPFFSFARNLASSSENSPDALTIELATTLPFDSYFSWYNRTFAAIPSESGMNQALGSWLLPRDVITDDYEKIAETLVHIRGLNYLLCAGGAVSRVDPASTGLNPAWRKALVHTIFTVAWPDGSPATVIEELEAGIAQNMTALRALAPDSGAYFNEASLVEPNPAYTFFGDHYDTLKLIKKKYDPLDLFVVTGGVGSDEWDAQLVCRR